MESDRLRGRSIALADDRGQLMSVAGRTKRAVITLAAATALPALVRYRLLRWCGIVVPATGGLRAGFVIDGGCVLRIGDGTWINMGCYFDCTAPITIGTNCNIAMGVAFCTASHAV